METHFNILLVDDEEAVLRAIQRTLRRPEYQIHSFSAPEMALLEAEKIRFDLVVSDYRMPRMDGLNFLRKLIVLQPTISRIMLTGYADLRAVMAAINEVGIDKFLTKPWKDEELCKVVADALISNKANALKDTSVTAALPVGAISELEVRYPGITEGVWGGDSDMERW